MSESPPDGGPVTDPEDPTGPGAQLREARHRANLSLEEVATQLRLDRRTLRALEENEFQHLPAPTFIRGYIRSYARLLGLPPGPILEAYDYQGFTPPAIMADITQRPEARFSDFPVRLATFVVAAGLVAMVVMWWHSRESDPGAGPEAELVAGVPAVAGTAEPPAGAEIQSGPQIAPPPAPPAAELIAADNRAGASANPVDTPDEPAQSAVAPPPEPAAPAPRAAEPAASAPPVADSNQAPEETSVALTGDDTVPVRDALITPRRDSEPDPAIGSTEPGTPVGPSRLKIRFREESWVEIFDADGIRREFRLARPGSSISVGGTPPFNVLLGYAEGATVVFDGEVHDIRPHIRGDTARFQIGPEGSKRIRAPRPREEPTTSTAEASNAAAASNPVEKEVTGSN